MPLYDLNCVDCDYVKVDVLLKKDEEIVDTCGICGKLLVRKPMTKSFELKYNPKTDMVDWQGNRSRYWDDYRNKKAAGEDVKPVNED